MRRSSSGISLPKEPVSTPPKIPPKSPPPPKKPISLLTSLGLKTSLTMIQNWVPRTTTKIFAHIQKNRGINPSSSSMNNCLERKQVTVKKMRLEIIKTRLLTLT